MYNYYIKVIVNILLVHFIIVEYVNTTAINKNDPYDSYISEDGLYDSNDNVIILNVTTLKNSIYESKKAWVVEFYNSWCGHCRRFAPLWKSLASEIVGTFYFCSFFFFLFIYSLFLIIKSDVDYINKNHNKNYQQRV